MRHVLQGSQLRRSFVAIVEDGSGDTRRGLDELICLSQRCSLCGVNVTIVVQRCQSLTLAGRWTQTASTGTAEVPRTKQTGLAPCKIVEIIYIEAVRLAAVPC
jgi:hypothetical protein